MNQSWALVVNQNVADQGPRLVPLPTLEMLRAGHASQVKPGHPAWRDLCQGKSVFL
jgi:hypothetical protein